MRKKTFLSIGECMLELSGADNGLWQLAFAGDTFNTAWYARACLDPETWRIAYFTRVGSDDFSGRMIDFMTANGIETPWLVRDAERLPGLYAISLSDGERSFSYWRDHSAARRLADDEAELARAIDEADLVYLSGITLAILSPGRRRFLVESVRAARAAGKLTAFDPNYRSRLWENAQTARETIEEAAGATQIVLPSFEDESGLFGDATPEDTLMRYRAAGAGEIAVKNGGGATILGWDGHSCEVTANEKVSVVDTTGAGDSFNGAYLSARLGGAGPVESARQGHRIAARVIGQKGALLPMQQLRDER
ncbi:MAG: sugar kinase [Pseudomonadota bacterium]|nr:sugar kinase [Pseudomonadota bacterium]